MTVLAALFAIGFAAVHLFIGRLRFLDTLPRSRWLSAAGGVAVAYVFLHLLPELSAHRETFASALSAREAQAEALVYLVALAGLAAFYGMERAAKTAGGRGAEGEIFWLHVGVFALYNLLIGYLLLRREETGVRALATYGVAMGLHFVSTDFGLREHHRERYDRQARWALAAAVLAGWALGAVTQLPELAIAGLFAFLAGAVVLNVLKEELPEERESRFGAFALGATGYSALLILA